MPRLNADYVRGQLAERGRHSLLVGVHAIGAPGGCPECHGGHQGAGWVRKCVGPEM